MVNITMFNDGALSDYETPAGLMYSTLELRHESFLIDA